MVEVGTGKSWWSSSQPDGRCICLLIFPCTIKSRSSLLAPAHPGGPGKRAVKQLWCRGVVYLGFGACVAFMLLCFIELCHSVRWLSRAGISCGTLRLCWYCWVWSWCLLCRWCVKMVIWRRWEFHWDLARNFSLTCTSSNRNRCLLLADELQATDSLNTATWPPLVYVNRN